MVAHLWAELVVDALHMTIARRKPAPGLVHHSDRGVQGLVPSMGRVGSAYDNTLAESLVASLKTKLLHRSNWPTQQLVRTAIFEYIEGFHNTRRRHSTLGHLSPLSSRTLD
jgi:putative transposase